MHADDAGLKVDDEDASFIAHARDLVPALCNALEAARAENERLQAALDTANRMAEDKRERRRKAKAAEAREKQAASAEKKRLIQSALPPETSE